MYQSPAAALDCSESGTPLSIRAYIRNAALRGSLNWGRIQLSLNRKFHSQGSSNALKSDVVGFPWAPRQRDMSTLIATEGENGIRGFQQLVVDAVELAGSISPSLKGQLISVLGSTFPSGVSPTIGHQKASLPAVLRMLVYARHEADRFPALRRVQQPLDTCVAFLIEHASYSQFRTTNKYH